MSDYIYTVDGESNATITGYAGIGGNIVIPSSIDGYTVVGIGEIAFSTNTWITSVTLPASITNIGTDAFRSDSSLAYALFMGDAPTAPSGIFDNAGYGFVIFYQEGAVGWTNPWNGYTTQQRVTNFYADIDDAYTGTGHVGTSADPFTYEELTDHSFTNTSGNTYNIKGIHNDTFACGAYVNINENTWQGWNSSVNGPWRIKSIDNAIGTSITLYAQYGSKIKGGIFYAPSEGQWLTIIGGDYYSCIFIADGTINIPQYTTANFYGCSLYGTFDSYPSCTYINFYNSCIDQVSYLGSGILYNCAIADSHVDDSVPTDCQLNWSMPTAPQWDGDESAFAVSILAAGIDTPPEPGNAPYTGYETGLWGEPRTGIGAMYFGESGVYTITYDGNDETSGTAPVDNNLYDISESVIVLPNSGNLTKTGCKFIGWNTSADGSDISYPVGYTLIITDNITLYAYWIVNSDERRFGPGKKINLIDFNTDYLRNL